MFLIITLGVSCLILWFYIINKKNFSFKESLLLSLLLILWYFLMTAIIEKITYFKGLEDYPQYVCYCIVLNTDNSVRKKSETERKIYQSNIKEINDVKVNKD